MLKIITSLLKLAALLLGGALMLGGGTCAVADVAILLQSPARSGLGGAAVIFMFLAISVVVALIGWLIVRFVMKRKAKQGDGDESAP